MQTWVLDPVHRLWPAATAGPKDELTNVPIPFLVKEDPEPLLARWAHIMRSRAARRGQRSWRWAICWRRGRNQPLLVMDLRFALELLHTAYGPFGHLVMAEADMTPPPTAPPIATPNTEAQVDNDGQRPVPPPPPAPSGPSPLTPDVWMAMAQAQAGAIDDELSGWAGRL